jgi:histidine triad (HIT) family protein
MRMRDIIRREEGRNGFGRLDAAAGEKRSDQFRDFVRDFGTFHPNDCTPKSTSCLGAGPLKDVVAKRLYVPRGGAPAYYGKISHMNDCIFCKIVSGDIPSFKVFETGETLAFLDIHPVAKGHTLVIPKNQNSSNIFDIAAHDWSAMMETARVVAIALERSLGADGVNLMMNNREHAGQVVFHPHVHLIPRFKGDGLTLWPHGSYKEGEAEEVQKKITAHLS